MHIVMVQGEPHWGPDDRQMVVSADDSWRISLAEIKRFCRIFDLTFQRLDLLNDKVRVSHLDGTRMLWSEVGADVDMSKVIEWQQGKMRGIAYKLQGRTVERGRLPDEIARESVEFVNSFLRRAGALKTLESVEFTNFRD